MSDLGRDVSFGSFFWHHLTAQFEAPDVDLTGRTILVTGGNAGLGLATVLHAARSNAERIIIASRDRKRCEYAAAKVFEQVKGYRGKVDVMILDLASFASVRSFCGEVDRDEGRLDIVVANAGMLSTSFKLTADGHEQVFQVNDLSTGLMALLLLPKLVKSASMPTRAGLAPFKPHLTIVASEVHYWAMFPQRSASGSILTALNDPAQYGDGNERYNTSKLLDIFIAREIAKLPAVTSGLINVNSVNPGLCKSGFRDDLGVVASTILNWIAWTTEFGSRSIFHAATQSTTPGAYISSCAETPPSNFVVSAEGKVAQHRFWRECMSLWEEVAPMVKTAATAK